MKLENVNIDRLDIFEKMQYDDFIASMSKKEALQIIINSVEGDLSQLSKELSEVAKMQQEYEPKENDFFVNEHTIINNFDFQNEQIYEFMKWGQMQPYRKFKGSIEGKKLRVLYV
jgi:hypothetical protein